MQATAVEISTAVSESLPDKDHPVAILSDRVTIAVAAHGNAEATQLCLEAILRSVQGDYELILVDDCSADNDTILSIYREARKQHERTLIYQAVDQNLEYSGSVNTALSHGRGDYIFFISNDILTTPYYFSTILKIAAATPLVGTIRGSSNFVDNGLESHNLQPINTIENLRDVFQEGRDVATLFGDLNVPEAYLTGDAFLVTRELIEKIGTFDPLFYGYFSDHDFGLRAQIAGFSTLLAPGAYAYHIAQSNFNVLSSSEREQKLLKRWTRVFENWARFKMKYRLPVELAYGSINDIPWQELGAEPFSSERHFTPAGDYKRFQLF